MTSADAHDEPELPDAARRGEIIAGKYVVEKVLGVGGMGVVVSATHAHLDQRVALKMMLTGLLHHRPLVERFEQEARAAVRLRSEHVTRILDVGRLDNGAPYIVMEYLEGRSLAHELNAKGPLSARRAVGYVLQACEAVAEAHALGIVHRDLKPDNLFLTTRVHGGALVKVLDFGIAKAASIDRGDSGGPRTHATAALGTPEYMAPEQVRSARDVDARADIWSLGVVLYELLSGVRPFEGDSPAEVSAKVLRDAPTPLRELQPGVPRGLAEAIHRCLQKEPAARFASVGKLADALAQFAPDGDQASRRISAVQVGAESRQPLDSDLPPPPEVDLEEASDFVEPRKLMVTMPAPPLALTKTSSESAVVTPSVAPPKRAASATLIVAITLVLALGAGGSWWLLGRTRNHAVSEPSKSAAHELHASPASATVAAEAVVPSTVSSGAPSSSPLASAKANPTKALKSTKTSSTMVTSVPATAAKSVASVAPPPPPKPMTDDDVLGGRK